MNVINMSRRQAIAHLGSSFYGFYLGLALPPSSLGALASSTKNVALSPMIRIDGNGHIHIYLPKTEMGQGVFTTLAKLIAEELNAKVSQVSVSLSPIKFDPKISRQSTGGSSSVRRLYYPLRYLGAAARQEICKTAAAKWGVKASQCELKEGLVVGPNSRQIKLGELVPFLKELKAVGSPKLKRPEDYKYIGKSTPPLDAPDKCSGVARFGIDAILPSPCVYAAVEMSYWSPGDRQLTGISEAKKIPGVIDVLELENTIAVIAHKYWNANIALKKIEIKPKKLNHPSWTTAQLFEEYKRKASQAKEVFSNSTPSFDQLPSTTETYVSEYMAPYLAHFPMEPMACVIQLDKQQCKVWLGTQVPESVLRLVREKTGLPEKSIHIYQHFLGGSFGRKLEVDYVAQAIEVAKKVNHPVKIVWSRKNDVQYDAYRPASYCKIEVELAKDKVKSWKQTIVCPSIELSKNPDSDAAWNDSRSIHGTDPIDYKIPFQSTSYVALESPVSIGYWRAVGHSQNAFFIESMINQLAKKLKQDPFSFRYQLLSHNPRMLRCLKRLHKLAKWDQKPDNNVYRGVACHYSFKSYAAQVMEIRKISNESYLLEKVYCVVDCGLAVDPEGIKKQLEGAIIFGLSAAIKQEIDMENGKIKQSNFHDFPCLTLNETPEIVSDIISEHDPIGGIGEVALPPVAPALASALSNCFAYEVRRMPFKHAPFHLV